MYLLTYNYGGMAAAEFSTQPSWSNVPPTCPRTTSNCKTQLVDSLPDPTDSSSSVGSSMDIDNVARYVSITAAPWGITEKIMACMKNASCNVAAYYSGAKIYSYDMNSQQLTVNGQNPYRSSASTIECVFNALEKSYPALLSPANASKTSAPYTFRTYNGNAAIGVSSADNHLYYIGAASQNKLADLGLLSNFKGVTGCQ